MIRVATINDLDRIVEFNLLLAKETKNISLNTSTMSKGVKSVIVDKNRGSYFLYEMDGNIIGQLLITYEYSDWKNKFFWWIQSVYISKEHRNHKVFSKLFTYISSLAKDMDSCGIKLYFDENNTYAQEIYKGLGLKINHYNILETLF